MSTATIYRRRPTKRELILAVAGQIAADEGPEADTGSLDGDLREMFEQKRRAFSGKVAAALVSLVGESAHNSELAAAVRESILVPTRDYLTAILNRATARGQAVRTADAEAAARLIVGLIVTNAALHPADADGSCTALDVLPAADAALVIHALKSSTVAGAESGT